MHYQGLYTVVFILLIYLIIFKCNPPPFSLQIPPPKPPPPEMHFIPNPNNTEFIYLLGIEQCVEHILLNGKMQDPHPTPFVCTQCGTDFTPSWKWDKSSMKGKGEENGKDFFSFFTVNKLIFKGDHICLIYFAKMKMYWKILKHVLFVSSALVFNINQISAPKEKQA